MLIEKGVSLHFVRGGREVREEEGEKRRYRRVVREVEEVETRPPPLHFKTPLGCPANFWNNVICM